MGRWFTDKTKLKLDKEFGGGDFLNWDCLFDLSVLPVLVNFNSQSVLPMLVNLNSQSVLPILVNFNYQSVLSILQVTECSSIGILHTPMVEP